MISEAAQVAHDFDAVAAGKHNVQDEKVEVLSLRQKETVLPGCRNADLVLVRFKALLHGRRQLQLVFHYQYPHDSNVELFSLTLSSETIQEVLI
jgi:hypothetical protein